MIVINERNRSLRPQYIELIKELNTNIKILAFVQVDCWCPQALRRYSVKENWILHHPGEEPPNERRVVIFTYAENHPCPTWYGMNPSGELSTWFANYVHDEVMSTGLFDGVFYDCLYDDMKKPNIDINEDGTADSQAVVTEEYRKGWAQLLKSTRELLGPEAIIIGAPAIEWSNDSPYWEYAKGHLQENVLGNKFGSSWPKVWDVYQRNMQKTSPPPKVHLINVDTDTSDLQYVDPLDFPAREKQKMRLGLSITLLEDGYFGFDLYEGHLQTWWFDEYDANLGLATGDAQERSDGTWVRNFQNGAVLVNPTNVDALIEFDAIYKDITTGVKDKKFAVPPKDGRIFIKCD